MKMPSRITLAPTEEDKLLGVCGSPSKCMYARTLRRLYPSAKHATVNPSGITIVIDGINYHYSIPKKASLIIAQHDVDQKKELDTSKARIVSKLVAKKAALKETPEQREKHRIRSKKLRASPGYIRPDSSLSLRARTAKLLLQGTKP